MKKIVYILLLFFPFLGNAQNGYEITINLKNSKDTLAYLTYYQFDKTLIKDTCTTIKNGKIIFKGKAKLDKGIYSLVSQQKTIYFDFFVDDTNQRLEFNTDSSQNIISNLQAVNSPQHNAFFDYIRKINQEGTEFQIAKQNLNIKVVSDSLKILEKQKEFELKILDLEEDFVAKNNGTYIADVINIKMEKILKNVPTASNGRPDSLAVFNYYKNNYWKNINFKDDAICRNPFFHGKLKKYFEQVVYTHPDSLIVEVDKMIGKTVPNSLLYKLLLSHFTYTYESSKIMGFDKVFVHMSDKYFKTGKAAGVYQDETTVQRIIKRADKLKPITVGSIAPDISMIDISNGSRLKQLGFENVKTSEEVTKLYYANQAELSKMYVKLHDVKADYTILIFWDVDCGHCQKEIPVLKEVYDELLKEKKDVKVYSVYTLYDSEKYKKYIAEHNLNFINLYDGAHINNIVEKYDVYSTPVIYILDKNKKIKAKRIGVDQIKKIISFIEKENK
ncbi:redoxin domain-containing protein [Flavobacterium macrobrachii]|uniref:redoxin domain-containing protein n=1 Tax=Flavobacterium macrobrachii TaxID=591204 RepID=UPI003F6EAC8A